MGATVKALGHIVAETTDLDAWSDFATDLLGLQVAERTEDRLLLRMDEYTWRIDVRRSDAQRDDRGRLGRRHRRRAGRAHPAARRRRLRGRRGRRGARGRAARQRPGDLPRPRRPLRHRAVLGQEAVQRAVRVPGGRQLRRRGARGRAHRPGGQRRRDVPPALPRHLRLPDQRPHRRPRRPVRPGVPALQPAPPLVRVHRGRRGRHPAAGRRAPDARGRPSSTSSAGPTTRCWPARPACARRSASTPTTR